MSNVPPNIDNSPCFMRQKFEWTDLPRNKEVKFELINWDQIKYCRPYKDTWYIRFVAKLYTEIMCPEDTQALAIIDIPFKTLERMIDKLPMSSKLEIKNAGSDNIIFSIIKTTSSSFKIKELKVVKENLELSFQAKKILYNEEDN